MSEERWTEESMEWDSDEVSTYRVKKREGEKESGLRKQ